MGRIEVQGQVTPIASKTPLELSMVAPTCHPSYVGSVNRKIVPQAGPGINARHCPNITKAKKGLGVAQVVRTSA
jgi:hypothetical protein